MIECSPHTLSLSSWVAGERARRGSELLPQGTLTLPQGPPEPQLPTGWGGLLNNTQGWCRQGFQDALRFQDALSPELKLSPFHCGLGWSVEVLEPSWLFSPSRENRSLLGPKGFSGLCSVDRCLKCGIIYCFYLLNCKVLFPLYKGNNPNIYKAKICHFQAFSPSFHPLVVHGILATVNFCFLTLIFIIFLGSWVS